MELSGWDILTVGIKTVVYAATLGAAGTSFFAAYAGSLLFEAQRAQIRRLIRAQLIIAALGSVVRILLLTGSMSGTVSGMFDRDMASMLLQAGEGNSLAVRIGGLVLAACALSDKRLLRIPALLGAMLACCSFAAVGHVRALHPYVAATVFSCVHLTCVAFWVGALVPLLWSVQGLPSQVGAIATRFSALAVAIVSLLIVAGFALLWMLSSGHADFWSTAYGVMIASKLLCVALLLGAAAFNKLRLTPRLKRGDTGAVTALRRSIQMEIIVVMVILVITASFTSLAGPPR